jgi:hypothetical protein
MQDQSSALRMMVAACFELANKYLDVAKTTVHPGERFEITRMAIHCNVAASELAEYLKPPSTSDPWNVTAARSRPSGAPSSASPAEAMATIAQLQQQAAMLCKRARTFSSATSREDLLALAAECEKLAPTKRRRRGGR